MAWDCGVDQLGGSVGMEGSGTWVLGEGMELWMRGVVGRGEDEEERRLTYGPAAVRAEGILANRSNRVMGMIVMEELTWTSVLCKDGFCFGHSDGGRGELEVEGLTMWGVVKLEAEMESGGERAGNERVSECKREEERWQSSQGGRGHIGSGVP